MTALAVLSIDHRCREAAGIKGFDAPILCGGSGHDLRMPCAAGILMSEQVQQTGFRRLVSVVTACDKGGTWPDGGTGRPDACGVLASVLKQAR